VQSVLGLALALGQLPVMREAVGQAPDLPPSGLGDSDDAAV
jgi:hypothetical protein